MLALGDIKVLEKYFDVTPSHEGIKAIPKINLCHLFDDDILFKLGRCIVEAYNDDWQSMTDWAEGVDKGFELQKQERSARSKPWDGASNFKSPTLQAAALKFSDRISMEILRSDNLVKTKVIGKDQSKQKLKKGDRVSDFMNYQLTVESCEWKREHCKMLYDLPYVGTDFKKVYYNSRTGKNESCLVTYPNFAVDNNASSDKRLRRFSEVYELPMNQVESMMRQEIWREVEFISQEEGETQSSEKDNMMTFIEQLGWYDLDEDGYEEPYTFVVHQSSAKVVRIMPRFQPQNVLLSDKKTLLDLMIEQADASLPAPEMPMEQMAQELTPEDPGETGHMPELTAAISLPTPEMEMEETDSDEMVKKDDL